MSDIDEGVSARNTLLALADEVEGYDRYECSDNRGFEQPLEDRIERACGLRPDDKTIAYLTSGWTATGYRPLRFLTSVDAALKLVPPTWTWILGATGHAHLTECLPASFTLEESERHCRRIDVTGDHTPAAALTAACLRAWATMR